MRLTSAQFDGDGGYDAPLNQGSTATAAPAAPTSVNTNTAEGIAAASAAPAYKEPGKGAGMNPERRGNAGSAAKAPKAIDKSAWDRSTKVSQSMVDYVKSEGRGNMGAVPQKKVKEGAPGYYGSTFSQNAPVGAEYKEAVKRVYPNGASASKPSSKSADKPAVGLSTGGAKAFPKIAAPKTNSETVKKLRNAEISAANNKGTALNDRVAYAIINAGKEGLSAYGAGTQNFSQIPGTKTKTAKAQEAAKAERAKSVAAAAAKKKK